jgi:hypothetical protein
MVSEVRRPAVERRGGSPPRRRAVRVSLLVADSGSNQYAVSARGTVLACPEIDLPSESASASLATLIEETTEDQFGIEVSYDGLLAFDASAGSFRVAVLVTTRSSLTAQRAADAGLRLMTAAQIRQLQPSSALLRQVDQAEHRRAAAEFASTLGARIQDAFTGSLAFLARHISTEDGLRGWSQYLDGSAVGVLSTAQGLLAHVHAGSRAELIDAAADALVSLQNADGGWQVRRALVGRPSDLSVTESTCYSLWALLEAGRSPDSEAIARGVAWLEAAQADGAWTSSQCSQDTRVITTASAVRVLAALRRTEAVRRGAEWLRRVQSEDGGWASVGSARAAVRDESRPAPTAHALLALLAAGDPADSPAVARGIAFLRASFRPDEAEPWRPSSENTLIDDRTAARLDFRHFATPWALAALTAAGADLSDEMILRATQLLLRLQSGSGGWRCELVASGVYPIWALHDALFALRTIVSMGTQNLAPMASLPLHTEERALTQQALLHLMVEKAEPSTVAVTRGARLQMVWMSVLTVLVVLAIAYQFGLLDGLGSGPGLKKLLTGLLTAVISAVSAALPQILIEEYKIRRSRVTDPNGGTT